MKILLTPCLVIYLLAACSRGDSTINTQIDVKDSVNLETTMPGDWDRICILGPYSTDQAAAKMLGFHWPIKPNSVVGESDSISLLLFVRGNKVTNSIEHPRNEGDFSKLSGRCFFRYQAKFKVEKSDTGWPFVVPASGA